MKRSKTSKTEKEFKLSRSKIELFCECPKCFILERKFGVTRPSGPPFTLNNAIDALWKKEFDLYRTLQTPHPILFEQGLNIVPFQHESIDDWRNNRRGVKFSHAAAQFLVCGAPDEVCINKDEELAVVDVKAASKASEIDLDADWQISYKRQMEIYQWLLRQNGFKVSKRGYFVYCNGKKDESSSGRSLTFEVYAVIYVPQFFGSELEQICAKIVATSQFVLDLFRENLPFNTDRRQAIIRGNDVDFITTGDGAMLLSNTPNSLEYFGKFFFGLAVSLIVWQCAIASLQLPQCELLGEQRFVDQWSRNQE